MVRAFNRSTDLERARSNPAAVFATPEQLGRTPDLTRAEKIELLRRWSRDAGEVAIAEEEPMAGGEQTLLDRILTVIDQLESQAG